MPEEDPNESGISEKEEVKLSEVDDKGYPCWRNKAKIELDVEPVRGENNDWIGFWIKT